MADERPREQAKPSGIWDFIKSHAAWIGGGIVGIIAVWYLVFQQNASSSSAPQSVSFPPQGGGPPSNLSGIPATTGTATQAVPLPFNPDFTILKSITDSVLQGLYSSEYNLELQINQAVQNGQDTSMLYSQLSAIQQQIAGYTPAGPTGSPAGPATIDWNGFTSAWVAAINKGNGNVATYTGLLNSLYGVPVSVGTYIFNISHQYKQQTGLTPTNDQLQAWYLQGLQQAGTPTTATAAVATNLSSQAKGATSIIPPLVNPKV